ncbi:ribonuclease domain-containing protein [Tessaracoccus terricola]
MRQLKWDLYPQDAGPRGMERLVTGSDGSAYYTRDHYESFVTMRGPN